MPAISHCVKINEDNAGGFCASLALGVMWHRRNALEYALPFYLFVSLDFNRRDASADTKIPVCSIRGGALSAWSLTHQKEPETCGDDHHPPPQPYHPSRPSSSFSCKCRSKRKAKALFVAFWRVLAHRRVLSSCSDEGLAREKGKDD
jgi:hypothetical protein